MRLENVINMVLYKKSLSFSLVNSKSFNVGELVNYMQVDAQKLKDLPQYLGGVLFLPVQLGIAVAIMYQVIGFSFLAGIGVLLITFVLNFWISKYLTNYQKKFLEAKDVRMKLANEIISGIKLIKVNAWEKFYLGRITESRENELKWLIKSLTINVISIFSLYLTPMLILSATFTMYTLTDNPMTPERVFTLVSTFVVVRYSIRLLPWTIASLIQARVSIKRIQGFLLAEEIDLSYIKSEIMEAGENSIVMKNGFFFWDKEKKDKEKENNKNGKEIKNNEQEDIKNFSIDIKDIKDLEEKESLGYSYVSHGTQINSKYTLKNLNLTIKKGSLTTIIGEYKYIYIIAKILYFE